MKILIRFILLFFLFEASCEEERGACYTCCGTSTALECKPDITKSECDSHNKKKTNGYSWKFEEDSLCPLSAIGIPGGN